MVGVLDFCIFGFICELLRQPENYAVAPICPITMLLASMGFNFA
jgi:hypothetical protein